MGRLRAFLTSIPQRFWFVPALFIAAAILVAQTLVAADRASLELPGFIRSFLFDTGVDGARALLASVAAFLGVAGTAFSITISVISTASTTYGPRLVRNFMRNRDNQVVLGVLTATFVYTLLVLRTIRSTSDDGTVFVPHLAVNAVILLGIIDVFLFVWFIHHIASSVQVETISEGVRRDFQRAVGRNWLDPEAPEHDTIDAPTDGGAVLGSPVDGYLTHIDGRALADAATAAGVSVRLLKRAGDQVIEGEPIAQMWPAERAEGVEPHLRDHLHTRPSRSTEQDVRFAEQQIVELAVRGLSPGNNDPYTAVNAIQQVASGVTTVVSRAESANVLVDEEGVPRVYLRPVTIGEIVDTPFDHIRPYALGARIVLEALVDLAARIRVAAVDPEVARLADLHVDTILSEAELGARDTAALRSYVETSRAQSTLTPPAKP
ncbi:DUF2254 domain-containing protein [Tessaracoccus sp. MC1865]|uniref:DUF2254 domain-containing protein n=1 Tax=Tessaracoccus sp. MC1865 TaxID=2760310 RepID=UPI0016042979|nr:DUF2254 domain-containing protein [Tessaracoccus sp. MC1865]MBB1484478.1 DUF2254 domain-containing protein [Tessaracoccus sp. MC1865]QTO38419.1 DUF2254 domain-containing protein [Tessaracoccus sp. MC1865]